MGIGSMRVGKSSPAVAVLLLGLFVVALAPSAARAAYPEQPIKIVIGNAPGGGVDIMARLVGTALSKKLDTVITVDNKPGAGGTIGADFVAKAKPDGYTILLVNSALMAQPVVYARLPYDTMKDLVAVTGIARGPTLLVASPTLSFRSGREFVDLIRASPGKYNYASLETLTELSTSLFNKRQGLVTVRVPYKAVAQMMPEISVGTTHYALTSILAARPFIESGKLRAVAVASPNRSESMPDVPTFREAGLADMEIWNRYGIFVPAGTPRAVVDRLQQAAVSVLKEPEVLDALKRLTLEPFETTVEQYRREMAEEFALFKRIGAEAGIKPE